jgi:hypothetical protein
MEGRPHSEILIYQSQDNTTRIDVRLEDETVWLTQGQMEDLFQTTKQNIGWHIKNIFQERELVEMSVVKESFTTARDGKPYRTKLYNLDVIISVGYRVKSHRGTQFRIWATQRLKEYVVKGFTLDDERLKDGGTRNDYFDELIERVREIRTSERNFYRKITDIYSTSYDYDIDAPITKRFFATVQNKFHWAIHGHTAAELIAERADASKPHMGLTSWRGERPGKADVTIAKNYLTKDELKMLNLIVDQYLSFAEFQAHQRKPLYMGDWVKKLDGFLRLNERDILAHAGRISAQLAEEIAEREFDKYRQQQREINKADGITDLEASIKSVRKRMGKNPSHPKRSS